MSSHDDSPLYDQIGDRYDDVRQADPYLLGRFRTWLSPRVGARYLDAGCGTGNYTVGLATAGGTWVGVDRSAVMLGAAAGKSSEVSWVRADLLRLPFADAAFAGVVVTLVLHHLRSLDDGYASLARVLEPGGRLCVFTSTAEQMTGYWLGHYFPDAMARSIAQMPGLAALDQAAARAGLVEIGREPYEVRLDLTDSFLYRGKDQPRLYLDAELRRGSSTFAQLADPAEVERGVARLAEDVASGAFVEIAARYANDRGDYLFLIYARR